MNLPNILKQGLACLCIAFLTTKISSCAKFAGPVVTENRFDTLTWNPFLEKDFPFVSTFLDARNFGKSFPDENVVSRGLIVNLDDSAYLCFDRDLLRWSVAWTGKHITESMFPQVSYNDFFSRKHKVPLVAGTPVIANGMYPGWSSGRPVLEEIRSRDQEREGFYWGALPESFGRWNGCYVHNDKVILSYHISGTAILELPGVVRKNKDLYFTRTLEVGGSADTLFLNLAEIPNGRQGIVEDANAYVYTGEKSDTIVAASIRDKSSDSKAFFSLIGGRNLVLALPPSSRTRQLTVFLWKGRLEGLENLHQLEWEDTIEIPAFEKGGASRWPGTIATRGKVAPDTAAFVTDILTLPLPNTWKRNIRVTDLAFVSKTKAVVTTFEGDVWTVDGINDKLDRLSWKRFASGLYEPMSVEVYKGEIYVFGKEGIVRLHDLNNDGEADFYENFSDVMQQAADSYEWAADMVFSEKNNGIIIAKGGGVPAAGITKILSTGFRAGSNHSGVVMKISMDGRRAEVISTGFRAPYLGVHPKSGLITVTDQQGNYVSTTPIYIAEKGDYFGVLATKHRNDNPEIKRPLTWIPHRIDRSAGSEVWIDSRQMGPLNNGLVHFSFGKPGLFKVLFDSTSAGIQGGVIPIHAEYSTPILKGSIGPEDGQLYMAGFNLFGSSSKGISAIQRLRYTGIENNMPVGLNVGMEGIIISFDTELEESAVADPSSYRVKRWNYQRTKAYGSGHFKMDASPGEEILPVLGSYLSEDRKKVLLLIPDMRPVDQMEVLYTLKNKNGKSLKDGIWFSVNSAGSIKNKLQEFKGTDLNKLSLSEDEMTLLMKSEPPITRERGEELFTNMGCIGCHSPGVETAGMYGPPFKGLYGSSREMVDGTIVTADDVYLTESILRPEAKIVKNYEAEMPSFQGILSQADIEALLLYIMYLKY